MLEKIELYEKMVKDIATTNNVDNFGAIDSKGNTIKGDNAYKLLAIQLIREGFDNLEGAKKQVKLIINTYKEYL